MPFIGLKCQLMENFFARRESRACRSGLTADLLDFDVEAPRGLAWASAAAHLGKRPVALWLASLARRRVYQLRWDLPSPRLRWRRQRFETLAVTEEGPIRRVEVSGLVSGPF